MKKPLKNWLLAVVTIVAVLVLGACSDTGDTADTNGEEVYTGVAEGHNGDLEVEITVVGDELTAVNVTDHQETEGIADPAFDEVPQAIVDAQSTDVEVVSGATVTSEAIMDAVTNAASEADVTLSGN